MNKDNHYYIYDLVSPEQAINPTASPAAVVYPKQLSQAIFSKHFAVDGERIKTIYFSEYNPETGVYNNPVIKETYSFTREDNNVLAKYVDIEISWMLKSGSWSTDVKSLRKYFSNKQKQLDESVLRRKNICSEVAAAAANFGLASAINELYDTYFLEIGKYKEAGSKAFYNALRDDTQLTFLDYFTSSPGVTIRMWLMSKFIIGTI